MKYKKGDSLENWNFTVIQENMDLWAEILNDPNPIHLDVNSVKLLGLGEKTINQGHANIAYIINAINYNFPESEIIKLNNKMTDSIVEGDKITVSGQIDNIVEENTEFSEGDTVFITGLKNDTYNNKNGEVVVIVEKWNN